MKNVAVFIDCAPRGRKVSGRRRAIPNSWAILPERRANRRATEFRLVVGYLGKTAQILRTKFTQQVASNVASAAMTVAVVKQALLLAEDAPSMVLARRKTMSFAEHFTTKCGFENPWQGVLTSKLPTKSCEVPATVGSRGPQ
jgi:hypothetical protein